MKRKIWVTTLALMIVLTGVSVAKGQYKRIDVFFDKLGLNINGQPSSNQLDGMIYNGTIYLPIRAIGETMNGQVTWNSANRSVDIDFITSMSDPIIAAADYSIYQYVAIEKNQIMSRYMKYLKDSNYNGMKTELANLQKLEELSENIGDDTMSELFNRMAFSGEVIRSGLANKTGKDYKLASELFAEAESQLTSHLLGKLSDTASKK